MSADKFVLLSQFWGKNITASNLDEFAWLWTA
jgi:hypothetical protein